MIGMAITCVICGTNKNPSLMINSDTCNDCGDKNRHCENYGANRLAKIWKNAACPECAPESVTSVQGPSLLTSNINKTTKPSIIETLSTLGWCLFAMMGFVGLFFMSQYGGGVIGVAIIIGGVFQVSIFLGFSAIIDQLYPFTRQSRSKLLFIG